jgi:hypothetical protein
MVDVTETWVTGNNEIVELSMTERTMCGQHVYGGGWELGLASSQPQPLRYFALSLGLGSFTCRATCIDVSNISYVHIRIVGYTASQVSSSDGRHHLQLVKCSFVQRHTKRNDDSLLPSQSLTFIAPNWRNHLNSLCDHSSHETDRPMGPSMHTHT